MLNKKLLLIGGVLLVLLIAAFVVRGNTPEDVQNNIMDNFLVKVVYPNGGEVFTKESVINISYGLELSEEMNNSENIEKQLYLIRSDGFVEGLISDIVNSSSRGEMKLEVSKLKYPAGLDVVSDTPPAGKYRLLLVVYQSTLEISQTDMPRMVFWSGSDRFDGEKVVRKSGEVVKLLYFDVSDEEFEIK